MEHNITGKSSILQAGWPWARYLFFLDFGCFLFFFKYKLDLLINSTYIIVPLED